tara:strand:- start:3 stop:434 length:432 start_codon:yes stop_codon:yes gene_type:complete
MRLSSIEQSLLFAKFDFLQKTREIYNPDYVSGDERLLVKEVVHFFDNAILEPSHYNYPALFSYLYASVLYLVRALGGLDQVGGVHLPMGFVLTFNIVLLLSSAAFSASRPVWLWSSSPIYWVARPMAATWLWAEPYFLPYRPS